MTKNQRQLPVVDVDQAFPLLTTDTAARRGSSPTSGGDQGATVATALRDVLGWRPRTQDTKAFNAALAASFELSTVEGHVQARYVERGIAVQADLGGITGGQASLYARAKSSHEQITRMLDGVKPLRPDADPEDCEAFRALIRDAVRQVVQELGMPGGPRVELVDSAFRTLTGFDQSRPSPGTDGRPEKRVGEREFRVLSVDDWEGESGHPKGLPVPVPTPPGTTADDVPGTLGALRDRMGLTDDNVNTVDEEKIRTSFLTLVDLVIDLQRSWEQQRVAFGRDAGRGFLGTEMVLISRLLAAAAEQVDEVEAVLDSALISAAERQTIVIDRSTRLTLDGLLSWMRTFLTEDGPRIIQDTGRDGITTSFTPTAVKLLQTLRDTIIAQLPASQRRYGQVPISLLPVGCCSTLPAGMYAARTRIAFSGLCSLVEQLVRTSSRIGRFSGVILFDVFVTPYLRQTAQQRARPKFLRVEVRGLHLRPSYIPAFVKSNRVLRTIDDLVLPVRGSATGDTDSMIAVFRSDDINLIDDPFEKADFTESFLGSSSWTVPAAAVPLAVVDGETGTVVLAPRVRTWPQLAPADAPDSLTLPEDLDSTAQTTFGVFDVPPDEPDDDDCAEPEPPTNSDYLDEESLDDDLWTADRTSLIARETPSSVLRSDVPESTAPWDRVRPSDRDVEADALAAEVDQLRARNRILADKLDELSRSQPLVDEERSGGSTQHPAFAFPESPIGTPQVDMALGESPTVKTAPVDAPASMQAPNVVEPVDIRSTDEPPVDGAVTDATTGSASSDSSAPTAAKPRGRRATKSSKPQQTSRGKAKAKSDGPVAKDPPGRQGGTRKSKPDQKKG